MNADNDTNDENLEIARQKLWECVKEHAKAIEERHRLLILGRFLLAMGLALIMSAAVHAWTLGITVWDGFGLIVGIFSVFTSTAGLRHNRRWLKMHKACMDNLMGILETEPNTILHAHYLEQGFAALHEMTNAGLKHRRHEDKA